MSETKYAVPMYESERGWGSKIDGYAGPLTCLGAAELFREAYNKHNNSASEIPEYYIAALYPVEYTDQKCEYQTTVNGVEYYK